MYLYIYIYVHIDRVAFPRGPTPVPCLVVGVWTSPLLSYSLRALWRIAFTAPARPLAVVFGSRWWSARTFHS